MSTKVAIIAIIATACIMAALKPDVKKIDCCYGHSMIIGNITGNTVVPRKAQ